MSYVYLYIHYIASPLEMLCPQNIFMEKIHLALAANALL
jgi:hypothetical protein